MSQPETIWKLIGRKPYAALAAALLFVLQAALGVAEVLVLENGRFAEQGSFAELTAQKGRFYHIRNEQVKWYQAYIL